MLERIGDPGALATGVLRALARRLLRSLTLPARLRIATLHCLVLFAGIWIAFAPTITSGLLQTDPGDTLLNHYILEHSWKWLSDAGYSSPYWSPPCFYPAEQTL